MFRLIHRVPTIAEFAITIGGIGLRMTIADSQLRSAAERRYSRFLSVGMVDCLAVDVCCNPRHEVARQSTIEILEKPDGFDVRRHDMRAFLDADLRRAELELTWPEYPIVGLDCFLRLCYSVLALKNNGVLLHSAGVVRDGRGWVFPGISGSGKSTVAALSTMAGGAVLSDEISLVKREPAGWTVFGTPFHGDLGVGANESAPLSGLLFVKKAQENELRRLDVHEALQLTSRCTIFFSEKTRFLPSVFGLCCEIAGAIPCYEMRFRRDTSFWQVIDDVFDGQTNSEERKVGRAGA